MHKCTRIQSASQCITLSTPLHHLLDPGIIFRNLGVDIGNIWVITPAPEVERHNADC